MSLLDLDGLIWYISTIEITHSFVDSKNINFLWTNDLCEAEQTILDISSNNKNLHLYAFIGYRLKIVGTCFY